MLTYNLSSRVSEGQHPLGLLFYVLSIVIVILDLIKKFNAESGHNKYIFMCTLDCIYAETGQLPPKQEHPPYKLITGYKYT